jgi:vacuolar protein sorting-associated protein 8
VEEETSNGDAVIGKEDIAPNESNENGTQAIGDRIVELLQEERDDASTPPQLGNGTNRYKANRQLGNVSEDGSLEAPPKRTGSPIDSLLSIPDDTPSVQVRLTAQHLFLY